jgi:hypothetical protein
MTSPARIATVLLTCLFLSATASPKCPVSRIEVHGKVVGTVSPEDELTVTLYFSKGTKRSEAETIKLNQEVFSQTIAFSTEARDGYLGGLFGEWGEKCDRAPKRIVLQLKDKAGRRLSTLKLDVHRDFTWDVADGYRLRSAVVLPSRRI